MRLLVQGKNNHKDEEEPPQENPQEEYNCLLLSALAMTTTNTTTTLNNSNNSNNNNTTISLLDDSLEDARTVVLNSYTTNVPVHSRLYTPTQRRRRRHTREEWILAYNRGLVLFAQGHLAASIRTAWTYLQPILLIRISDETQTIIEPSSPSLSSSSSPPLE